MEQYVTLTLISNELIVRNVITENTTGISKALGITTLIMSQLECCHPDFASSSLLLPQDQLSPLLSDVAHSEFPTWKKKDRKAYNFVQRNIAAGTNGNTVAY